MHKREPVMPRPKIILLCAIALPVVIVALNVFAESPDESIAILKEGNARFVAMVMQHPDLSAARRADTAANGQKPFAAVLACSDSRVPVELIFDRGIGDIFVVRVAGNIAVDPTVIGSIEYAAEHLGTPLLVIMGHTDCGAVKAAIFGPVLGGDVRAVQESIEPAAKRVKKEYPALSGKDLTLAVVKENVRQVKKDLLMASGDLRHLALDGKIKVVTAVYDLKTGVVQWID